MARMGVFSRQDDTPDAVPRSLQLLSYRNTFDARYMEILPNYHEILYPNESVSINVTNFVRSLPMKRPQLSRVRVYQKFVAVPIRLLWSAWEDYIKGENDADFLYTEPYVINATDGGPNTGSDSAYDSYSGIIFDGGIASHKANNLFANTYCYNLVNDTKPFYRGILLDVNSYVPDNIKGGSEVNGLSYTERQGYMKVGIHELGDYFSHPIGVSTGKFGSNFRPFSAFKFAAYQLAYSFFERSPNVQTRIDDFYQMAQDDNREFPRLIGWYEQSNYRFEPPEVHDSNYVKPLIRRLSGTSPHINSVRDVSKGDTFEDKLRTSWEFVEKFPLKSGANLSMLASSPDPVTGLPRYVPSNISLTRKRFANWQTDYFISCNPWPQRGEEAKIPLSGTVTVNIDGVTFSLTGATVTIPSTPLQLNGVSPVTGTSGELYAFNVGQDISDSTIFPHFASTVSTLSDEVGTGTAVVVTKPVDASISESASSTGSGTAIANTSGLYVSPSNFRFAMTLQHIKEMQAQIDNRYQSYIRKFFGARARDYRLDRPEFLGGSVMELNVSDVTQTSQSTSDSLLGDLAGKSVSASTSRTIRYHADEHTVILGYIYIQPDTEYIGGLSRIDSTKDRFDWALPQFSHLSEQAVYNWEIAYQGIGSRFNDNHQAFGYEPVLNHLRWRPNVACGAFRDTMNQTGTYEEYKPWINVRDFGIQVNSYGHIINTCPTLSDEFLSGRYNRDNSNFDVVDDDLVYPFMVDSYFKVRAVRTISTRGTASRLG